MKRPNYKPETLYPYLDLPFRPFRKIGLHRPKINPPAVAGRILKAFKHKRTSTSSRSPNQLTIAYKSFRQDTKKSYKYFKCLVSKKRNRRRAVNTLGMVVIIGLAFGYIATVHSRDKVLENRQQIIQEVEVLETERKTLQQQVTKTKKQVQEKDQKLEKNQEKLDEANRQLQVRRQQSLASRVINGVSGTGSVSASSHYTTSPGNGYFWGQCVWYVYERRLELGRPVPGDWHDANQWLYGARADGWPTGSTPKIGAVAVQGGHVAVVEKIDGDKIYISEMNVQGVGVLSHRWEPAGDYMYIY